MSQPFGTTSANKQKETLNNFEYRFLIQNSTRGLEQKLEKLMIHRELCSYPFGFSTKTSSTNSTIVVNKILHRLESNRSDAAFKRELQKSPLISSLLHHDKFNHLIASE